LDPLRRRTLFAAQAPLAAQDFFLPEEPIVPPSMTVFRYLSSVLTVYGLDHPEHARLCTDLLEEFALLERYDFPFKDLSRGQRYKAGLVALLAVNPDLWLVDEPFASGMDPPGIEAFKRYVQDASKAGKTIIFSTQILDVAEQLATEIFALHEARLHVPGATAHEEVRVEKILQLLRQRGL